MNRNTTFFYGMIISCIITNNAYAHFLSTTYDRYLKRWISETAQYTYELDKETTVCIDIPDGNILVKGWNGTSIVATVNKQAPNKEYLDAISFKKINETEKTVKLIAHTQEQKTIGTIDVTVLVPKNVHVALSTHHGTIKVKELEGNITASAQEGKIRAKNISGKIIAHVDNGTITIKKATNNIKSSTLYGNITLEDVCKSAAATTEYGKITVSCKHLSSQSSIHLSSTSGTITLALANEVNADLYAKTEKGTLICEPFITTKPQTMQLNNKTWQRLKREVNGILGTGEARITVSSINSSIKILDASRQTTHIA